MPFTSARNSDCVFYEQGDGLPCGTSLHYYESIEDSFPNKVFSVAHYLGLRAVALLTVSDIHPIEQEAPKWEWHMTEEAFLFSGAKCMHSDAAEYKIRGNGEGAYGFATA